MQHEESRDLWRQWFADAGLIGADVSSGAVFHEAGVLIDVAMAAQGVVLGRVALAEGLIAQGVLRILSDRPIGASASYWLCYPEARRDDPVVAAFRAFVFEEVGLASAAAGA